MGGDPKGIAARVQFTVRFAERLRENEHRPNPAEYFFYPMAFLPRPRTSRATAQMKMMPLIRYW